MASPLDFDRGRAQLRSPSSRAVDGSFVYELGHSELAEVELAPGDYNEVSQDFVLESQAHFIRPAVRVRCAGDSVWLLTGRLNGTVLYSRQLDADSRDLFLQDIAISLAGANASPTPNTLAFRLELVS